MLKREILSRRSCCDGAEDYHVVIQIIKVCTPLFIVSA